MGVWRIRTGTGWAVQVFSTPTPKVARRAVLRGSRGGGAEKASLPVSQNQSHWTGCYWNNKPIVGLPRDTKQLGFRETEPIKCFDSRS